MRRLIVKGKELSPVLISHGDPAPERYAASELCKYLGKIGIDARTAAAGANVSLVVDTSLPYDGYAVDAAEEGTLTIRGGSSRGVIYGVYGFLEKYAGMRFFMPGVETLGEGDVAVDEGLTYKPVFEMRQVDWRCGAGSADWCVKNGINMASVPDEMGGRVRYGGFVHTMERLAGVPQREQPCFSDPDVLKKAIASVREILKNDPGVTIVSVSQNDNMNYCKCPRCAAIDAEEGSHAGSLLRFVNAVAADVAKDYPSVVIDTLAYQHTRKAPAITKPLPNVCIRLCSIECCFSHPLSDPTCAVNAAFCRDIIEWNKICSRIYIWDYVTDFRFYVPTFPNFGVLRENMRFFAEHGVKGMYPEGNYNSPRSGEFGELRCYLLAKLMKDPYMSAPDYNRHMDEFLEAYYGAGWRNIRAYLDVVCAEAPGKHMNIWNPPFSTISGDFYGAMEETFDRWWDEAEQLAGDRLDAVRRSRLQWQTIKLMLHPDAEKAKELLAELESREIMWREGNALPKDPDLSVSPANWR